MYSFKKAIILIFSLFAGIAAAAQSYEDITSSDAYIYGEGAGKTPQEAKKLALSDISGKIKITVESNFKLTQEKSQNSRKFDSNTNLESVVKTYSQATLPNYRELRIKNEPGDYRILCYIERSEIERVFTDREAKVKEMIGIGLNAEDELKIGTALKYYYWASIVCNTLPHTVKYTDKDGNLYVASIWLESKITTILENINVTFKDFIDEDQIKGTLNIYYKDKSVADIDYRYSDGINWAGPIHAVNGVGPFDLRADTEINSISVQIEYAYDYTSQSDKEIYDIINAVEEPVNYLSAWKKNIPLCKAQNDVPDKNKKEVIDIDTLLHAKVETPDEILGFAKIEDGDGHYRNSIRSIADAIKQRKYYDAEKYFTEEGFEIFTKLIDYGNASILDDRELKFIGFNDRVFCRSIPMSFSFRNNNVTFGENVVFTFDTSGRVDNISFALADATIEDIVKQSKWENNAKMALIDFLENYKTAFALKRIDYIESIFSDDAYIIVGRVVRKANVENRFRNLEEVEYYKPTKAEYISNLRYSFRSKEYINIRFANMKILKSEKSKSLYGIQIKQDYFSSNYGDTGYLFLVVDVSNYKSPIIYVRTWQPKPDPERGIFGPYNFDIL